MENRYCKKCLLDKVMSEAEYEHMLEYISAIDSDLKTEKVEYNRRLAICTSCENLINGICKICGCFVEIRAANKKNYCPNIDKLW